MTNLTDRFELAGNTDISGHGAPAEALGCCGVSKFI